MWCVILSDQWDEIGLFKEVPLLCFSQSAGSLICHTTSSSWSQRLPTNKKRKKREHCSVLFSQFFLAQKPVSFALSGYFCSKKAFHPTNKLKKLKYHPIIKEKKERIFPEFVIGWKSSCSCFDTGMQSHKWKLNQWEWNSRCQFSCLLSNCSGWINHWAFSLSVPPVWTSHNVVEKWQCQTTPTNKSNKKEKGKQIFHHQKKKVKCVSTFLFQEIFSPTKQNWKKLKPSSVSVKEKRKEWTLWGYFVRIFLCQNKSKCFFTQQQMQEKCTLFFFLWWLDDIWVSFSFVLLGEKLSWSRNILTKKSQGCIFLHCCWEIRSQKNKYLPLLCTKMLFANLFTPKNKSKNKIFIVTNKNRNLITKRKLCKKKKTDGFWRIENNPSPKNNPQKHELHCWWRKNIRTRRPDWEW